jgi:hypothetical protein
LAAVLARVRALDERLAPDERLAHSRCPVTWLASAVRLPAWDAKETAHGRDLWPRVEAGPIGDRLPRRRPLLERAKLARSPARTA